MEKRTEGAWLIHHTKKLFDVRDTQDFEDIELAGKCGIFLSNLAADENTDLNKDKVDAIAKASSIKKTEIETIKNKLVEAHLIDVVKNGGISVLGITTSTVLSHTANIFDSSNSNNYQKAALELSERISDLPKPEKELKEYISDEYKLTSRDTVDLFSQCEEIGFIDYENLDNDSKFYFNGNLFRKENIQKTKFELIESLPSDGVAILNKDDEWQTSYHLKNNVEVVWIGITNQDADVVAYNIKCSNKGSTFDIKFKDDDNYYPFETKLLGKNNIYNILASVALGKKLGMSINELQQGVRKVRSIEHRLELKDLGNIYMIDDAYNSNPVGAEMAVEVLKMMPGTKVVVTPGMIELGDKQEEYNEKFGTEIASAADYVILIGKNITKPIYNGLIKAGYKEDKIFILNKVVDSYPLINKLKEKDKDIYALFENDLPDSYNED